MANDFSKDADCVAVWRFEAGILLADKKGNNTLTAVTGTESATAKEGSGSVAFSGTNQGANIADAGLVAGFPLKNGDTIKRGTWLFWVQPQTAIAGAEDYDDVLSKSDWNNSKMSLTIQITGGNMVLNWGYGAGQDAESLVLLSPIANQWYHFGVAFDGINKFVMARCWDDTAQEASTVTHAFENELRAADVRLNFAASSNGAVYVNYCKCLLDEVAIFKRPLSADSIDRIRQQVYGAKGHYLIDRGRSRAMTKGISLGM